MRVYQVFDDGKLVLTTADLSKVGEKFVELSNKCEFTMPFWSDQQEVK